MTESFEKWAAIRGYSLEKTPDSYKSQATKSAWRAWRHQGRRVAELEAHNETRNIELLASVQQCAQLKAQLAETEALEISHGERIEKLTKLLLLAKDALEDRITITTPSGKVTAPLSALSTKAQEAIAAINDSKLVEGLILCDAEPVGEVEAIDVDDDAQPSAWVCINTDIELGTPLYSPRRTEK